MPSEIQADGFQLDGSKRPAAGFLAPSASEDQNARVEADLQILGRVLVAMILSGFLGWERGSAGKAAGIRTHMLVGMGAALFAGLSELLVSHFEAYGDRLRFDPIRLLEAVLTGIGFLGAGVIFVAPAEHRVKGLTTAASIWTTAAIGVAAGLARFVLAVGATVMVFLVLRGLGWIETRTALGGGPDRGKRPAP